MNVASVKARLKNFASESGRTFQDALTYYVLSTKYPFEYSELRSAVVETFRNRHTELSKESAAFSEDFINDPLHQIRWMSFLPKKKALLKKSLGGE